MRHYFLQWSFRCTVTRISCGLFVRELVIPQGCEPGAAGVSAWKPFLLPGTTCRRLCEEVGYLRTRFQLLGLSREMWLL